MDLIGSLSRVSLSIALVIPVSPLLIDPISIDRSPILLISVSSPLLELELALVLLALLVPDSVPPLLPALVIELDWGSSASKSYKGAFLILAYC